eukprot:GFKZ01016051.1.p1 GENE.GFKZ01016051.1~~GFKZ01016051.1.p1  ORF type:complete len:797 (+),score=98.30 GFKZ01016051.1:324-2714(+)
MADQVDALSPAGISELATFIIRPPRARYQRSELGDRHFVTERVSARRDDVVLHNGKGLRLHASHFRPVDAPADIPTVVYLHGNGSCRVEATMLLHYIIPYGLSLFAFDFSGSGMSDGEYISLGVNEKHDVETVVQHLVFSCGVRRIILWGHSMGAATAIMYAGLCQRRPEVCALLLDSPFASFDKLAQSMVADMPIPIAIPRMLILTVGVRAVRKVVRERADFDVGDIDPLSATKKIPHDIPALFLHGSADAVVPVVHGEMLHKSYPSEDKELIVMEGFEHDTQRPEWVMDRALIFLQRHLRTQGPRDVQYLENLKARGNAALLSRRFDDAIYIYTEALNALSESITNKKFAVALGESGAEGAPDVTDSDDGEASLARRNSSISNFVSTVKRWRHARTLFAAEDGSRKNAAAANAAYRESFGERASQSCPQSPRRVSRQFDQEESEVVNPTGTMSPPTEQNHDDLPNGRETSVNDCARSDSSVRSGRFSRNASTRRWRARNLMDSIKNKMRTGRSKPATTTTPSSNQESTDGLVGSSQNMESSHPDTPSSPPSRENKRVFDSRSEDGHSRRGLSWRSRGNGKVGRSPSSRVPMGKRGKWRQGSRRSRVNDTSDRHAEKGGKFGNEEFRRKMTPDINSIRKRFSPNEDTSKQQAEVAATDTIPQGIDEESGVYTSINSWNLDEERKGLALALLGNRSLARRKRLDLKGALFDAEVCLVLDAGWVRGYLRKATALREDGRLEEARECVLEGLRRDGEHAGLADMLSSIEVEVEANLLANDRGGMGSISGRGDAVSAQG